MPGEIVYMNGQEMAQAIVGYGQAVSGMTAAEAAAQLGAVSYSTQGGGSVMSFPMEYIKGGYPVTLEGAYAQQVWDYWKATGEAAGTTALGAAGAAAISWANGVLIGDPALAGTLAGTGGLLTMSLPAAAVAMAPLLGVSLGETLYNSNPELWTKISQALLPWAYEDKNVLAFVVDELGQVLAPKNAIEALKDLFIQESIPMWDSPTVDEAISDLVPAPVPCGASFITNRRINQGTADYIWTATSALVCRTTSVVGQSPGSFEVLLASPTPGVIGRGEYIPTTGSPSSSEITSNASYTHNEKTVYYRTVSSASGYRVNSMDGPTVSSWPAGVGAVAWTIIYGTVTPAPSEYPTGTGKWNGNEVDITQLEEVPVINDPIGTTSPFIPITLPIGDPTVSPDPQVQPNPTAPVELPVLDPYIPPVTAPDSWPVFPQEIPTPTPTEKDAPQTKDDPVYVPTPDLNPDLNPATVPDIEPAEELPTQPDPQSTGTTPPIIFPLPDIEWPSIVPSSGSGLVHVYNPTPAEFISFGHWLWVTYADPSIQKLWNNPFDGVIGAHELYATPSKDGTDTIKSGFLDSGISSTIVRVRYTSINCGSMVIPEYWGNYLDYSPYSKAYVYLPFIGIVELDVDDIVGHAINIVYHIDSYNGSCIAQITVARDGYTNTIYQFSGNCAVDLPLAGGSQAAIRAGMISAAAYGIGSTLNGVVNGAAYGGLVGSIAGGITGAIGGAAAGIANVVSQKSTVQHSGSFGASYGAMGIKKPYIIIRRPVQKQVNGYQRDYGFPAHKRVVVGACTGFLRVLEVNVQSTLATDDEKAKIEELLKSGVYIS